MTTVFLVSCFLNVNIFPRLRWCRHDEETVTDLTKQSVKGTDRRRQWKAYYQKDGAEKEAAPPSARLPCKSWEGICSSLIQKATKLRLQLRPRSGRNGFMTLFVWNLIKVSAFDITLMNSSWDGVAGGKAALCESNNLRGNKDKRKRNAGWMDRGMAAS